MKSYTDHKILRGLFVRECMIREREPAGLQQFAGQNTAAAIFDSGTIY